MTLLYGYARVPAQDQNPALQLEALNSVSSYRVFVHKASGTLNGWPELPRVLDQLQKGHMLMVWKLDHLGSSLKRLIGVISELPDKGVEFRPLHETLDIATPLGKRNSGVLGALAEALDVSRAAVYRYLSDRNSA